MLLQCCSPSSKAEPFPRERILFREKVESGDMADEIFDFELDGAEVGVASLPEAPLRQRVDGPPGAVLRDIFLKGISHTMV